MSGTTVAAGENVQETYLRRLFDVLGAKGLVVIVAFPAAAGASRFLSERVDLTVAGVIFTAAFLYALVVDRERSPADDIDPVGVALVVLTVGYTAVVAAGVGITWLSTLVGFVVVFASVVYGYAFREGIPEDLSSEALQELESDPLHIDVVGLAVAEILVVYTVLLLTGWGEFASSASFATLAFLVYVGTVAAFAGYAVVTREIVVSRTDDEVHELLVGVLGDVSEVEDDVLRGDIATKMRLVADCLDGVKLPTQLEDEYGEVPVVLSTRKPDARHVETETQEIIEIAREMTFTGYVVHDECVVLFRNGSMSKYYRDGEYGYDTEELDSTVADATFHSLDHSTLNDLDDVTPQDRDVVEPEEVDMEEEERGEEDETDSSKTISVGGDEIDVEEMFEKADEIMDDLSE
jgi:hypothetical protein